MDELPRTRAEALAAGAGTYQSQNACPQGHKDLRYSSSGGCVTCMRFRSEARRLLKRDAGRAKKAERKRWELENSKSIAAKRAALMKDWRQRNLDRVRAYGTRKRQERAAAGVQQKYVYTETTAVKAAVKYFVKKFPDADDQMILLAEAVATLKLKVKRKQNDSSI